MFADLPDSGDLPIRDGRIRNPYPWYCARFWQGMPLGVWVPLLASNRFAVHPSRLMRGLTTTFAAIFNTVFGAVQNGIYAKRIQETEITEPPVFILGHWRCGTTFLHELMSLDDQFGSPNTYQCFAPHHFLVTQFFVTSLGKWMLPQHRPMDNVELGWNCPSEDEFALCNMGVPSPYARMAFPNRGTVNQEYLNMADLSAEQLNRWGKAIDYFVRLLTFHYDKRIILKSPTHTGRIGVLADLFPGARFIHLSRDPYQLYSSSCNLWRSLDKSQGFQIPNQCYISELVLSSLETMYDGFETQRSQILPENLFELRYEELIAEPVEQLAKIYEHLQINGFAKVQSKLDQYAIQKKNFLTSRHQLEEATRQNISKRWAGYFEQYGYDL